MVSEPRAGVAPRERDLLAPETLSQYFKLCPTQSFLKPATRLIRPRPHTVGMLGASKGPNNSLLVFPHPRCLLRERQENSGGNSLPSSPSLLPFQEVSLCSHYVIKHIQHSGGTKYKSWAPNSHLDDPEEGWKLTFLKYLLDGTSGAASHSNSPVILGGR